MGGLKRKTAQKERETSLGGGAADEVCIRKIKMSEVSSVDEWEGKSKIIGVVYFRIVE